MAIPRQITNLILDKLLVEITKQMQTDLPIGDPTRAKVVKKGLLQQSKVENNIAIGIMGGDHEDPNYRDGIVTIEGMQNIAQDFPAREIGGGQLWWRRGIVSLECFYIQQQLTESQAHDQAYAVLGRLLSIIEAIPMYPLVDDFGEHAIKIYCHSNTFFESGGPPNQYIFRGKVFWTAITERP